MIFVCGSIFTLPAQSLIQFRGTVYDAADSSFSPSAIVINKRTNTGVNSPTGTSFAIQGLQTDTFLVTAGGYEVRRFSFKDSAVKAIYTLRVGLTRKTTQLAAVAIFPVKDLTEIQKERATIGKVETRQTQGVMDAVGSPITYLYERFSREGKSREAVAIMENADNKRDILKELFRTYARAGVIVMNEDEYDDFIAYLNIPEDFLRNASDYDLAVFIRQRFLQYRAAQDFHNRNQR